MNLFRFSRLSPTRSTNCPARLITRHCTRASIRSTDAQPGKVAGPAQGRRLDRQTAQTGEIHRALHKGFCLILISYEAIKKRSFGCGPELGFSIIWSFDSHRCHSSGNRSISRSAASALEFSCLVHTLTMHGGNGELYIRVVQFVQVFENTLFHPNLIHF